MGLGRSGVPRPLQHSVHLPRRARRILGPHPSPHATPAALCGRLPDRKGQTGMTETSSGVRSDRIHPVADAGDRMNPVTTNAWYRLTLADVVFLVLTVGILLNARGGTLDDPGLGWHIRDIDAIQAQKGWLTEDPFSGPRAGQPWYTNQWLGDLLLWLGDRWGGLTGIAAVTALV